MGHVSSHFEQFGDAAHGQSLLGFRISAMGRASTANRVIFGIEVIRLVEWDLFLAITSNLVVPQDINER